MKKNEKMKIELEKRAKLIIRVEKKLKEIESILAKIGPGEVGLFASLSIREKGTTFENMSMLLGNGGHIIHALSNSFNSNGDFLKLAKSAIREFDNKEKPFNSLSEFLSGMCEAIDKDIKEHKESVDKENDLAQKN